MRLPGRRLRNAAARLFTQPTMDRVIDPIVADLQAEYREAVLARRRWLAVWVCVLGYLGFWRAVGLQGLQAGPQSLWSGIATDGWWLGRMIGRAFIAFVGVTLALAGWPMIQFYSRVQDGLTPTLLLLPQAIPLSIPIAIPLGIVCGVYGERVSAGEIRRVLALAVVATLLAFAVMLIVPVANQAFRVAMAGQLGLHDVTEASLPRGVNELSLSELATRSKAYDARGLPQDARAFTRTLSSSIRIARRDPGIEPGRAWHLRRPAQPRPTSCSRRRCAWPVLGDTCAWRKIYKPACSRHGVVPEHPVCRDVMDSLQVAPERPPAGPALARPVTERVPLGTAKTSESERSEPRR